MGIRSTSALAAACVLASCSGSPSLGQVEFLGKRVPVRGCAIEGAGPETQITLTMPEQFRLELYRNTYDRNGHPLPDPAAAPWEVTPHLRGEELRFLPCDRLEVTITDRDVVVRGRCKGDQVLDVDMRGRCKKA